MLFTTTSLNGNLYLSLPHAANRIGVLNPQRRKPLNCGIFMRKISVAHHYVELGKALERVTGSLGQYANLIQLDSIIGVMSSGLKIHPTEAVMPKLNAQEPINALNLSVSEVKKQSLQKQAEIIGHALNIFCLDPNTTSKDSLKKDALELVRMLDDLPILKKQSRFNIFASDTKKVIADNLSYSQAMQYRDPKKHVIKFAYMVGGAT